MTVRTEWWTVPQNARTADGTEPVQVEIVRRYDTASWLGSIFQAFFGAWVGMLALGGLHSHYPVVPAPPYWDTVLVLILLGVLSDAVRPSYRVWTRPRGR